MAAHLHLAPDSQRSALPRPEDLPIRVVLADDHALIRRSLRLLLDQTAGIEVVAEAEDLSETHRHVGRHLPDVLVLDLRMPNGSSLETIKRLREEAPSTEIVVTTMDNSPVFAQCALDAGALAYVLKDRADDELVEAVQHVERHEEFISPQVAVGLECLRRAVSDSSLSARETGMLRLIALGYTSANIGEQLHLSRRTVETHRASIHRKLGLQTRAELVRYALDRKLMG